MYDNVTRFPSEADRRWLHEALAGAEAIAWNLVVDVEGIETLGTMIEGFSGKDEILGLTVGTDEWIFAGYKPLSKLGLLHGRMGRPFFIPTCH